MTHEEFERMRELALAIVNRAVNDLTHPDWTTSCGAYQFLMHGFWHADCIWRAYLPELKRSKMVPKVRYLFYSTQEKPKCRSVI